jgi:hypothetical protein
MFIIGNNYHSNRTSMANFVTQQSIVNNLTSTFLTTNPLINILLTVVIGTFVTFVFNNLNGVNTIFTKIYELLRREYVITITDSSYLSDQRGSWIQNYELHGYNFYLIRSIQTYINKDTNFDHLSGDIKLDCNCEYNTNVHTQELNRAIEFKPTTEIVINKGPYSGLKIKLIDTSSIEGKSIHQTSRVVIKSRVSTKLINEFIKYCYNEYVNKEYKEFKDQQIKYFLQFFYSGKNIMFNKINIKFNITFDKMFFPEKQRVINNVNKFVDNKLNSTKFIMMLHGPPGCGKTSFIKSLSVHTNRHIQYIKLSEIQTFKDGMQIFFDEHMSIESGGSTSRMKIPIKDRLLIFEDIDAENTIVQKRYGIDKDDEKVKDDDEKVKDDDKKVKDDDKKVKDDDEQVKEDTKHVKDDNEKDKKQLSLSDVLQLLDGLIEVDGVMVVMTTNCIDDLDPALLRPGRVTMMLKMEPLEKQYAVEMIKSYYPETDAHGLFYDKIPDKTIIPALLENMCNESNNIDELNDLLEAELEKLKATNLD